MERDIILSRLLDKYENSRHLLEPGRSNRRVMLRTAKKELPEYQYEEASVRDAFNQAAQALSRENLVSIEWSLKDYVLSTIYLNLDQVGQCYQAAGRVHPRERAAIVARMAHDSLDGAETHWIAAWRDDVCANAERTYAVPGYCRRDASLLSKLLIALRQFDALHGETITMRAFSSRCYHDTKIFEREVRETFLHIAEKYHNGLAEICGNREMGVRDKLAFLGIYARPELYELSGNCTLTTGAGAVDLGAAYPYGIALPSTLVDSIMDVNLEGIRKIVFIENKTNYDEYLLSEQEPHTLAVYHGGFLSPQKRKLFLILARRIPGDAQAYFWADIDLGGFQMFSQLSELIPGLRPMRMAGGDVAAHFQDGLVRSEAYLDRLRTALEEKTYPVFEDTIHEILKYGVTIEQETFLNQLLIN